ncbi:hypothetical protein [Kibdelosporangium aridum]|uniref:hypothetical protein n=1 Tax=Kibdelosporangium aridum TaxID=2030 RepID=UPI0035E64767
MLTRARSGDIWTERLVGPILAERANVAELTRLLGLGIDVHDEDQVMTRLLVGRGVRL